MKSWVPALALLALMLTACSTLSTSTGSTSGGDAMPKGTHDITSSEVAYHGQITGHLAAPVDDPNAAGVVLIHESWGLNDNMKDTADRIASHGYRVLAVDLYNGDVTTDAGTAQKLSATITPAEARANLNDAVAYLRTAGSDSIASWGFGYGGTQAADLALTVVPVDATVVYYGGLKNVLAVPTLVDAPILLVYGAEDNVTAASDAKDLASKLRVEGVSVQLQTYPEVGNAFANPASPGYDAKATRDAWDKTLAFLNANII